MTLDERTLRAAGLPASLISLLVSITKAAERATAAANTASTATDLEPQIAAAIQVLQDMEAVPGIQTKLAELSARLLEIEAAPQPEPYNDASIKERLMAIEGRPLAVVNVGIENGRLLLTLSDGSQVIGPLLPVASDDPFIILTGGSLSRDGDDLVVTEPAVSVHGGTADGISIAIFLTRDDIDVTEEIFGGRIADAPAGDYVATWMASNGVLPSVTTTDSLTIEVDAPVPNIFAVNQWSLAPGANPAEIIVNISVLPANNGSPIRAIEYQIDDGDWELLSGVSTGPRTIQMPGVSTVYSVILRAINAAGASDPSLPKTVTSGAPAQQAPATQTPPQITGNTTVGSILNRIAGTATGIPTPQRSTEWLRNGTILDGQTANSLDTTGFAATDQITTRDVWSNGIGSPATGTSEPWVLTVQPAITATPPALTAGQQAGITFNTAIDGSPTVTQGGASLNPTRVGTTNEWTFTPATTQPVSISATKAGWTPYSVVIENVQAAPAFLAVDSASDRFRIDNMTASSPDFTFPLSAPVSYVGTLTLTSVEMEDLADGPVYDSGADVTTLSGDPAAVGETLVVDAGAWWTHSRVTTTFEFLDGSTVLTGALGNRYTVPSGMAGKTIVPRITGTDLNGPRAILLTGVSIPALVVAITSNFNGTNGTYISDYSGTPDAGRTFNTYGVTGGLGAITDGFLHGTETNGIGTGTGFVSVGDDVSSGNYDVEMPSRTANGTPSGYDARGIWVAFGIKGLTTGFQVRYNIATSQLLVEKFVSGTGTTVATKSSIVIAGNTDYTLKVAVNGTSAVVSLNGAVVPELGFTDADLAGGKPGYRHFRGNVNTNKAASLTVTVGA